MRPRAQTNWRISLAPSDGERVGVRGLHFDLESIFKPKSENGISPVTGIEIGVLPVSGCK
jgi:hypothetical protein